MSNFDFKDADLSKVPMCIRKLCGVIAIPGPPTCNDVDDCPGVMWKLLRGKRQD